MRNQHRIFYSTKSNIFVSITMLAFALIVALGVNFNTTQTHSIVAQASGIEDVITEDFVEFYENEIAKSPVITSMGNQIQRLQKVYGLNEKRIIMLLILQDFGARVGNGKNINELAQLNDNKLILYGKALVDAYGDTLPDDEKEILKDKFFSFIKS